MWCFCALARPGPLVFLCGEWNSSGMRTEGTGLMEQEVAHAWRAILDDADAIADDLTLRLLVPYENWFEAAEPQLRSQLRSELRSSTREHIARGLRVLAGTTVAEERPVDTWRATGRRRARQGVPMELVLHAYSLGTRFLWEALLDEGAVSGVDERVLRVAGQRLWSHLDVQNAVLVESYRRESARIQRWDLQRQQSFLDGLAEGRGGDPAFAGEAREVLGIATDTPIACVVAQFDGGLQDPLRAPEDRLEHAGLESRWHVRGGAYFGLVVTGTPSLDGLVRLLRPVVAGRVGVAMSLEGMAGFATAYRLAAHAAETLPRGVHEVVSVTDRLPEVLLGGSPEVSSLLVEEVLGGLLGQAPRQTALLLETLAALLAHDGSPTRAAQALYCHRNTVAYRMRQVETLTGRDLQDPRDKLLLSLALMAVNAR